MKVHSKEVGNRFNPFQLTINVESVAERNILYEIFGYQHFMCNDISKRTGVDPEKVREVMQNIRQGITNVGRS